MLFNLKTNFKPTGDQPKAITSLVNGLKNNYKEQTLLGVTGSGKTFTIANVINEVQKPTLVISHNKTLAAQLYQEFKGFFPEAAVHYFVSYYDYYQPEAYIPQTDTYIEKEATVNEEIDRLRHAATQSLLSRNDCIIIASVSAIYGLGERADYENMGQKFKVGEIIKRNEILKNLIKIQYERNELGFYRGQFRVRGENIDIFLATGEAVIRLIMFGDKIEKIINFNIDPKNIAWLDGLTNKFGKEINEIFILPAKHFITPDNRLEKALVSIDYELEDRLKELKKQDKRTEAERLERKTRYDMEMIKEVGYCNGIENYSRHLTNRPAGEPPSTLIDFFPKDYLIVIDESHVTLPQIRGMYAGDKSRKETLVNFGFRLPSALDNRPLNFKEFNSKINKIIYMSATPNEYEKKRSKNIAEQIIRPTGLLDPEISIRKSENQIKDLIKEIKLRVKKKEKILAITLTKRMAEELSEYLIEEGIKTAYIHSEIKTFDRIEILDNLKSGKIDCLVGINLLREGIDLPDVSLVAILNADMAGFLRTETALIQTMGRAARNINGQVIMYADKISPAMKIAINETKRRRKIQEDYNKKHKITPRGVKK